MNVTIHRSRAPRPPASATRHLIAPHDQGRRPRRRALVAVAALGVAATALTTTALVAHHGRTSGEDTPVAIVGGHPLDRADLTFWVHRVAGDVATRGTSEQDLASRDGEVVDRALQAAATSSALLSLSRDHGLTDLTDLDSVRAAMKADNQARTEAVARGQVIYGTPTHDLDAYYSRLQAQLVAELERQLSTQGGPLQISQDDIARAYDASPARWQAGAATIDYTALTVPAPAAAGPACAQAIASGTALEVLAAPGTACSGAQLSRGSLAPQKTTSLGAPNDPRTALLSTAVGETTPAQMTSGAMVLYRNDASHADRTAALATFGSRIRDQLLTQRFADYLAQRTPTTSQHLDTHDLVKVVTEGTSS